MSSLVDKRVTIELSMPELQALLTTVGIAIGNLMTKSNRMGGSASGRAANDDMVVLSGVQQELLGILVECSTDGGDS